MKKILMASFVLCFFSAALVLVQMSSCKKSNANCPTPVYPVSGLWIGTYQTDQVSHPATSASLVVYPDGTFMKRNLVVGSSNNFAYTRGTWTLTGSTFSYRDTTVYYTGSPVVETGTLTFSNTGVMTNGKWQDVSGQSFTGTFQNMKRVN